MNADASLVAVLNDQEWTARSLETILEAAGYRTLRAHTAAQLFSATHAVEPDAFILDVQLPDLSGMEVAARLRADPRFGASTPIILTTAGPSGRQQRLAAYEAGAWDFLGQPLDGEALLARLKVFTAARRATRQAQAERDALTGLYGAAGLLARARELAALARRRSAPLTCVAIAVEMEPAPSSGEQERAVGRMVAATCRGGDAAGRLAPNQYAVLALDADAAGADRLAGRLIDGLGRLGLAGAHRVGVTTGSDGLMSGEALLATASAALAA
ncbi:MAG TPA: response regulator [Gemmatimonadales bacterium]|nr:response regulator [Gemmatimonadales bacterium]